MSDLPGTILLVGQRKGNEMTIYIKDGNAFAILGAARTALREEGRSSEWDAFYKDATSGDYNHLLRVVFATFEEVVNGDKPKAPRKPDTNEDGLCEICGEEPADCDCKSCPDCGDFLTTYEDEWADSEYGVCYDCSSNYWEDEEDEDEE